MRLDDLLNEKRMSHGLDNPGNHLHGLLDMLNDIGRKDLRIIEIGSYEGATSELFAFHSNSLYCVDPYDIGEQFGQEDKDDLIRAEKVFQKRMLNYSYEQFKIKSIDVVKLFSNETYDLIYIDGDHRTKSVMLDILLYADKVNPDGWISGHDYFDGSDVKKGVDKIIGSPDKVYQDSSWIMSKENYLKRM